MMNSKIYLLSFCVCSVTFACLRAETCPISPLYITNGINAELIRDDTGLLLGIRVSWSWISNVSVDCFQSPVVELSPSSGHPVKNIDVTSGSRNNSVDFFNLDCNQMYTPKVKATNLEFESSDTGNTVFFGGSGRSPPSVLPRVCVGPSTLPEHRSKVNIFWELLPCHLQNGADISGYIILYTPKSSGVTTRFPSSNGNVECRQEFGDLYSCVVAFSLIPNDQAFSIQVAAQSNNGEGSFSDPVNILSAPVSNVTCTTSSNTHDGSPISTTSMPLDASSDKSGGLFHTTTMHLEIDVSTPSLIDVTSATSIDSVNESSHNNYTSTSIVPFIVEGIIGIFVLLGSVVVLVAIVLLMKRRKQQKPSNHTYATVSDLSLKNDQALQQRSTLCEEIDMKECSAYGQVISLQPVTEQPHIYESTT